MPHGALTQLKRCLEARSWSANAKRLPRAHCPQMASIRAYLASIGADVRNMLTFCENHDTDRFLR